MIVQTFLAALLAATAAAHPSEHDHEMEHVKRAAANGENPIEYMKRAATPGVVISKCTNPGMLALAYDDGPYQYTSKLVDTLDKAGAKGTFFWTGTLYGCIYKEAAAIKKAFDSGHQIASHTWTHSKMGSMSASQITTEMTKVEQALVNLIGLKPAYMRPPYLDTGGQFLATMKKLNYKVVTDDIDAGDWNKETPQASEKKFESAGAKGNGHIPLMHEVYPGTVDTLTPWLINWAKTNNLKLVTVAECLGDPDGMYQPGNFTATTGPNTC